MSISNQSNGFCTPVMQIEGLKTFCGGQSLVLELRNKESFIGRCLCEINSVPVRIGRVFEDISRPLVKSITPFSRSTPKGIDAVGLLFEVQLNLKMK